MVDIRIPIGVMFTILGALISVFGFITGSEHSMYERSLGINVNIIMGILMLVFGLTLLFFSRKKKS